jgi:hypothetical protein
VGLGDRLRAWLRGEDAPDSGARRTPSGSDEGDTGDRAGWTTSRSKDGKVRGASRRRGREQHPSNGFDSGPLLEFARSRRGVEVYLEPRTRLYGHSVLLVADDGEYLRRPVPDVPTVRRFCSEHGIPVYDAARTGYPRRVRDYDRGLRPDRVELDDLPPWPGDVAPDEVAPGGHVEGSAPEDEPPPPPTPTTD